MAVDHVPLALPPVGDLGPSSRPALAAADVVARLTAAAAVLAHLISTRAAEPCTLDSRARALYRDALAGADVATVGMAGEAAPVPVDRHGSVVVTLVAVDEPANLAINAAVGTIFSVLPVTDVIGGGLLQAGRRQLAAGIIVFGPATVLALTVGEGTDLYALGPDGFTCLRRRVEVPPESGEYAVNAANARQWHRGIRSYVADLVSGSSGPRRRDFSMRWLGSLAAEAYGVLSRGGIYLCPAETGPGHGRGRMRLVYEANPVAWLCEQAGGAATDGRTPTLDLVPAALHQRTPLVFGSRNKVDRVRRYLSDPPARHEESPLFAHRGLFRS
ncbi:fructose-1,6-bisphosphatase [Actinoplanes sp. KI2]|uniref:class 1 fructose-bisphosphatase n=1 Tax=Actinoplanes sp. KI2 TaxID=2983315 RepID=UPI0021D5B7A8|nr:class 1 fructose-bisphosphatase [Actinoplanes sp. KI2]MCU7724433.1 fructose-1,6-bisphosphatase [Actinoplanes sp. KI2]